MAAEIEVLPPKIEETTKAIAASAMNIAAQRIASHFNFQRGKWVMNPDNVPTLEEGYQMTKDVLGMKLAGEFVDNESSWLLGNLMHEMRSVYGDDFDIQRLEEIAHRSPNTLRTAESVYCAFQDCRVPGLSYTHHKEVYFIRRLSDEQKLKILFKAKEMNLSAIQVRALGKVVAREGNHILEAGDTELGLLNKIEKKKKNEPEFIIVSFDGRVRQVKEAAFTDEMDRGSQIIIQINPVMELLRLAQQPASR